MKKKLDLGALWLFRFQALLRFVFLFILLTIFSISNFSLYINQIFILSLVIIGLLIILVIVEVYARLAYYFWAYEFTNDNLKIERGIIWKRYSNIPYQRVQNVDITRGIIARIFGFSTVNIQTAGFSYTSSNRMFSEGYIPAVSIEEAERIREFVVKKIGKRNSQGL